MKGPALLYRALSLLATPLLLGWVARVAWRLRAEDPSEAARFLRERLGRYRDKPEGDDGRVWLHCASVGEVVTALPLIHALTRRDGTAPLVTTATPTGARELGRRAPPGTRHRYLPIDRPGPVRRFLRAERPRAAGIVETEIWPWLYAGARARGLPLSVLSARLSARTLAGPARALGPTYRRALDGVTVLARSEADAERWRALARGRAAVEVAGDLKAVPPEPAPAPRAPLTRPYVLAASTHADEEARLARAWVAHSEPVLLVIAPRHPERGAALARELRALVPGQTGVGRRSQGEAPAERDRVFLADTLGELQAWYAGATAAFVGGSLIERGGHNVLEPARLGVPVAVGPHVDNFAATVETLGAARALARAPDAAAVAEFLHAAAAGDAATLALGPAARRTARRLDAAGAATLARCLRALGPVAGAADAAA